MLCHAGCSLMLACSRVESFVGSALVADLRAQQAYLRWETGHEGQFYEGTAADEGVIRVKPEIRSTRTRANCTSNALYALVFPGP